MRRIRTFTWAEPSSFTILVSFLLAWAIVPLSLTAQTAARQAYTPVTTACMDGFTLVRQAGLPGNQTLGCEELAYITGRKANILLNAWKTYLSHLQATNLTFPDYVTSIPGGNNTSADYPSLGIACSGRGWRATMFGAGLLNVLDGRNQSSVTLGTGDLLQAASYITGLSGGSNLVGSLVQADFPTMEVLAFGTNSSDPTEAWGAWLTQTTQQTPYLNNTMNNKYLRGNYNAGYPVPFNDITSRDNGRWELKRYHAYSWPRVYLVRNG